MANEKHRRAFISYSRINKEFATKLVKGLRTGGYPVWFDLLDIPTGSRWDDEVEKALRECSIFMIILTPASIASENVKDEIGYAIDHGKRILPVLLEDCDVPLRLRRFQYVDFTTKSFEEGFESAKDLLGDLVDEASTPLPPKAPDVEAQVDQKAEAERLAKQKTEDERVAKAKAETERKAKEEANRLTVQKVEADKLAKQKVEDERVAKAKAETERKANEEADRLATQKAEDERIAKAKVEADRKAKEEAERLAAQKIEAERKAKAAPVVAMPVAMKAELALAATTKKKPVSKGLVIGIVAVVVLCVAGIGIGFSSLSNGGTPVTAASVIADTATEIPSVANTATKVATATNPPVAPATKTKIPAKSPTPQAQQFFTEEFDKDPGWNYFLTSGDKNKVTLDFSNSLMTFDLEGLGIYAYYLYEQNNYDDVRIGIRAENRGKNNNNVSLVCRASDKGWYEFSTEGGGLWYLYTYTIDDSNVGTYTTIANGGALALKQGKEVNEYGMICKGNEITLIINGEELRKVVDNNNTFLEGSVGFNISSLNVTPIIVDVDWFKISNP